jgi:hypothetical protein
MPTELWLTAQREMDQLVAIVATDSNGWFPSESIHDVESRFTMNSRKDQHLEAQAAAIELSKLESNEEESAKLK